MVIQSKTINLLILEDSAQAFARLVSLFDDCGQPVHAEQITSLAQLKQQLSQPWDLCLASPQSDRLNPAMALQVIQTTTPELAVIQLTENNAAATLAAALDSGVQDAVPLGEDQRLRFIVQRELAHRAEQQARRAAEAALQAVEQRCQRLLEGSDNGIAYLHQGIHLYANEAYLKLFNVSDLTQIKSIPISTLISCEDSALFASTLAQQPDSASREFTFNCSSLSAQPFAVNITLTAIEYQGQACWQAVLRTANQVAECEEKLRKMSRLDLSTGLYNRQHFLERLDTAAEQASKKNSPLSVAYIRLDHYAKLQSNLGITGIDQLLAQIAQFLRQQLSAIFQIARFTDDAFSALITDLTPEQAAPELRALLSAIQAHIFEINGHSLAVTLTIGIAGLSRHSINAAEVLKHAQLCADDADQGNSFNLCNITDNLTAAAERNDTAALVEQAIEDNRFKLLFQPIISLRGDKQERYEVLLRLINLAGEELAPTQFLDASIPLNLAAKVDRWVLLNAIKLLTAHHAKGKPRCFFIHLSSASLQDPSLIVWLSKVLKAARLPANSIILQLREADAITHLTRAKQLTEELHALHCQVALGQFGDNTHSFTLLQHLQIDFVKVDGSFTQDLSKTNNQNALKELLEKLHAEKKYSIVPFVESASVLSILWQAGVHYIQGYYLQEPSKIMDYDFFSNDA